MVCSQGKKNVRREIQESEYKEEKIRKMGVGSGGQVGGVQVKRVHKRRLSIIMKEKNT